MRLRPRGLARATVRVRLGAGCRLAGLVSVRLDIGAAALVVAAGLLRCLRFGASPPSALGRRRRAESLVRPALPVGGRTGASLHAGPTVGDTPLRAPDVIRESFHPAGVIG
ncbi:hypothetical protein [Micromonospora sp. NPDC049274]|uniref:hypothetical protein n=1 Tax=Micromonospora sp. NPDC049274 TaxID=3154829 RepID=UPI00341B7C86